MALQFLYDGYFAGTVGIGTIAPTAQLEIITTRTGTPSSDTNIKVTDDTAQAADVGGSINFTGKYTDTGIYLSGSPFIRASKKNATTGDYGYGLKFGVRGSGSATNNVAMTVDSDSNVGIGTTNPNVLGFLETGLNIAAGSSSSTTLQQAGLVISGSSDSDDADDFGYLSFTNYQSTLSSDRVAEIRINKGGSNVNTGKFNFYTANGTALNESMVLGETGLLKLSQYGAGTLVSDASGNITAVVDPPVDGITFNNGATITNQINTDVDTGTETIASVAIATHDSAFFDFVVKKGTNVRSGTVYACHDGDTTPLVAFTETSTNDLGDTSDVTLSVDISGTNMRLLATVTSDDWSIKSLIRAI